MGRLAFSLSAPRIADLLELSPADLAALVTEMGERPYRARQVCEWVYKKGERDFARMSDIPQGFREKLASRLRVGSAVVDKLVRSRDGATAKYLFRFDDRARVEAVLMRDDSTCTACVSSQVGCAMHCAFCATGTRGFKRNLTAGEILVQPLEMCRDGKRITNVVFMGMGEPLLNLDNVIRAVEALTDPARFGIGARRITISTCGIPDGIEALAHVPRPVRLALSLNSPFQAERARLMPIARKHSLDEVLRACSKYADATGRRVTLEYVLLGGVNDSAAHADELARIAKALDGKVNLIEYNPHQGAQFFSPTSRETLRFRNWLERQAVTVTIRFRRGREIRAGCGQLAAATQDGEE